MSEMPTVLYDAEGTRRLDDSAIKEHGIPGFDLMSRAAGEAYRILRRRWPDAYRVLVVCGSGNNGGDGYVVGALAARDGLAVTVVALGDPRTDDARRAREAAMEEGCSLAPLEEADFTTFDVIVDAMFGTGLTRAPEGAMADAISKINACPAPVLSLDIPSGLDADTGCTPGSAIHAAATITFIALKPGLITGKGPEYTGDLHYHSLDVPREVFDRVDGVAVRIDRDLVHRWLPRRSRCAHKGTAGHVLLAGGNDGMTGALRIAAEAAARSGAGLVTAATKGRNTAGVNAGQPEIMVASCDDPNRLPALLETRRALGVGPGLGRDAWARDMFENALSAAVAKVVDADALWFLAGSRQRAESWVLTPHPGEAARLLGVDVASVENDRISAARQIVERYGGVCVLKGCGTVIADRESLFICDRGNPGMATGGMGDCLTGVITALLGQGLEPIRAAVCGVWLHASAADLEARENGQVGLLASDLFPWLRHLLDRRDA
jgi:NAD(P)H-hydrate epimerase